MDIGKIIDKLMRYSYLGVVFDRSMEHLLAFCYDNTFMYSSELLHPSPTLTNSELVELWKIIPGSIMNDIVALSKSTNRTPEQILAFLVMGITDSNFTIAEVDNKITKWLRPTYPTLVRFGDSPAPVIGHLVERNSGLLTLSDKTKHELFSYLLSSRIPPTTTRAQAMKVMNALHTEHVRDIEVMSSVVGISVMAILEFLGFIAADGSVDADELLTLADASSEIISINNRKLAKRISTENGIPRDLRLVIQHEQVASTVYRFEVFESEMTTLMKIFNKTQDEFTHLLNQIHTSSTRESNRGDGVMDNLELQFSDEMKALMNKVSEGYQWTYEKLYWWLVYGDARTCYKKADDYIKTIITRCNQYI